MRVAILFLFVVLLATGCNKSRETSFGGKIERERSNRAEYEGRTEDAAKHQQKAAEYDKKQQDYEAWKRSKGK